MSEKKGYFISIEGCEGTGKSTQLRLLAEYCADNYIDAVFTREPGGTRISESVREIILNPVNTEMDDMTELLLYCAARRQHVSQLIAPAVAAGKLVVCDRFTDSTLCYQGYARGLNKEHIEKLNRMVMGDVQLSATVFLDLPPKDGFIRKGGADKADRLENEKLEFHNRVYEGYKHIAAQEPQRVLVVDASKNADEVFAAVIDGLKQRKIL